MAKHPRSSSPHRASSTSTGRPDSRTLTAVQDFARDGRHESIERLVDTGLRLNEQAGSDALHAFLIDEVAELLGARRVLLVLETADGPRIVGAQLPEGETPEALLQAVAPWLDEARRTRAQPACPPRATPPTGRARPTCKRASSASSTRACG